MGKIITEEEEEEEEAADICCSPPRPRTTQCGASPNGKWMRSRTRKQISVRRVRQSGVRENRSDNDAMI